MAEERPSKSRRPRGDGAVFDYVDSRGRKHWQAAIELPRVNGKRRRATVTGPTRTIVVRRLKELRHDLADGRTRAERGLSLGAWLDDWLSRHTASIRESTAIRYGQLAKLVPDELRDRPLVDVQSSDLEHFYIDARKRYAANTVLHVHRLLHAALKRATREGLVSRNVSEMADAPRVPRQEVQTLSEAQVFALLQAAQGDRYEALYMLAVTTGIREGELLALRWQDVDWSGEAVMVRGTLRRLPSDGLRRRETKTGRERRISLAPTVLQMLQQHRVRQHEERLRVGSDWLDEDLIFARPDGRPTQPWSFIRGSWQRVSATAGIAMPFKDASRHAAASLLVASGIQPKVVSEILGHTTISITMDRYSHLMPGGQRDAMESMERMLKRRKTER